MLNFDGIGPDPKTYIFRIPFLLSLLITKLCTEKLKEVLIAVIK